MVQTLDVRHRCRGGCAAFSVLGGNTALLRIELINPVHRVSMSHASISAPGAMLSAHGHLNKKHQCLEST